MITVLSLALVLAIGVIVLLLFKRSDRAAPLQPLENPERNDKTSLMDTGIMSGLSIPQPEETTVQGWQPDALVVLDKDLKLMWANSTAEKWFEFSLVDSFGQSLSVVTENQQLSDYLTRGEFDHVLDCSPPSMPESIARVCIIRFAEGMFLLQARDISRIKILENVKRDFVANASHELRTPVSVLYGYLEMMLEDDVSIGEQWQPAIAQMHEQTQRIKQIIEDMLLLSRLEDSDHEEDHVYIEVMRLLDSAQKNAKVLSGSNSHEISLQVDEGYSLLCNVDEMQSLLNNLISNAVRYTPASGRIEIIWESSDERGRLTVADSGIGIGEQDLIRITERFYRTEPARALVPGGTGLGLAIVNHIASRHQAELEIDSELGKGSRFTVTFPRNRVRRETSGVDLLLN